MTTSEQPADTRMMGIVHNALQRDLLRLRATVSASSPPLDRQRRALGEHAVWLMEFLHSHHSGEDRGLWPLVRKRNPAAGALMDSLEADHAQVEPAATAVAEAGRRYADSTSGDVAVRLVAALDELLAVLVPHLDREVAEGMPVVAASITHAEWKAVEDEYFVKGKSMTELGREGHWLLDGIDADGYDVVVSAVSPVPRFILLHAFRGTYRRRARMRWGPDQPVGPAKVR